MLRAQIDKAERASAHESAIGLMTAGALDNGLVGHRVYSGWAFRSAEVRSWRRRLQELVGNAIAMARVEDLTRPLALSVMPLRLPNR